MSLPGCGGRGFEGPRILGPVGDPSDRELVERWRSGEESAREALVLRHYPAIERFFGGKLPAAAADLTQQTFLACLEAAERLEKAASFRAFLFGVARYVLLRHLRSEGRRAPVETYTTRPGEGTATPTGVIARQEEQVLLLRALESIPIDQRIVIELHYWESLDSREIAEVLRVPQSTVTTRLSRARARLVKRLEELESAPAVAGRVESWLRSLTG